MYIIIIIEKTIIIMDVVTHIHYAEELLVSIQYYRYSLTKRYLSAASMTDWLSRAISVIKPAFIINFKLILSMHVAVLESLLLSHVLPHLSLSTSLSLSGKVISVSI